MGMKYFVIGPVSYDEPSHVVRAVSAEDALRKLHKNYYFRHVALCDVQAVEDLKFDEDDDVAAIG